MRFLNIFILSSSVYAARYDFDFTGSSAISGLDDDQSRREFTTVFCFDGGVYFDNCKVKFGATEQLPIVIETEGSGGSVNDVEEAGSIFSFEEVDVFFENAERTESITISTTKAPVTALDIIGSFESSKR
jgi:hypothetical protein